MKRTGPLRDRILLRAMRAGVTGWRLAERLGLDLMGASEGPPYVIDDERRRVFDRIVDEALERDGIVDTAASPYAVHELLSYLVIERRYLLHGTIDKTLAVLEPRPARDFATELHAVVAADDAIWPMFYAVVDRRNADGVFTGCTQLGRPPRLRRLYFFIVFADAPSPPWSAGMIYVLPRDGFEHEWGHEWVSGKPVRPILRVPVEPADFPLRDATLAVAPGTGGGAALARLRAAKR